MMTLFRSCHAAYALTLLCLLTTAVPSAAQLTSDAKNRLPELEPIRFERVGVGQRIFFGVAAIDEEGDDIRVEMTHKPASAKYNEETLTVDWTPTPKDRPEGTFVVKITEFPRDQVGISRCYNRTIQIAVQDEHIPESKLAPAPLEVETLVSITDVERLSVTNERWPITKFLERIAEIEFEKQTPKYDGLQKTTGEAMFRDMLRELATLHGNDGIDPDSPNFNPSFAAEHWRIIAIRPRLNKKVFELRFVFFNEEAAEQVYVMPRMRIIRGKDADFSEEIRQKNNLVNTQLIYEAFFDGPNLKPFVENDKKKYAEAACRLRHRLLDLQRSR